MNYLRIDAADLRSAQEGILDHFPSSVESFDFGNKILLSGPGATGDIYFLKFSDGISMVLYDCDFKKGLDLEVDTTRSAPLYMFYAMSGGAALGLMGSGKMGPLPKYQPVIMASAPGRAVRLSLSKDGPTKLLVLEVDRKKYAANRIKLLGNRAVPDTIFADCDPVKTTIHTCSPNLHIADLVHRLSRHTLREAYGIFVLEAEANLILGHILAHYVTDVDSAGDSRTLTKKELERVRELAAGTIARNPGGPYTIRQLASDTGLAPNKLQQGFRHLYGRTVADHIRDRRLIRAAELLGDREYNVSEVVAMVGLNSNSHFSKIFKNKYDCSPKEYQHRVKQHKIFEVGPSSKARRFR